MALVDFFWVGGTGSWNQAAHWSLTSGGAGGAGVPGAGNRCNLNAASGGGTVTVNALTVGDVTWAGFTGTSTGGAAVTVAAGGWVWGAGQAAQNYTGNLSFTDTSGATNLITSNGQPFKSNITFNGVGGVWSQSDNFSTTGVMTLTNGSFSTATHTHQAQAFSSNNSNARTFDITGSAVTYTDSGTVWQTATATLMVLNVTGSTITFSDSTASSKTFQFAGLTLNDITISGSGSGSYTVNSIGAFRDWSISGSGAPTIQWHGTCDMRNLVFTAFNGTWVTDATITRVQGNFTLSVGMAVTNNQKVNFTGTGVQLLTSNGISLGTLELHVLGTGNTVQLQDALVANIISVATGGFDDNNKSVTVNYVSLAIGTTLGIAHVWTITGSNAFAAWDASTGVLISLPPNLNFTDATATTKTMNGGGYIYGTVTWSASGTLQINNSSIFQKIALASVQSVVHLQAGQTQTISDTSALSGTAGNLNTIVSDTPGTAAGLNKTGNFTQCDYLSLQDLTLSGGAFWYVGKHSVNAGNTNGGRYTNGVVGRAS